MPARLGSLLRASARARVIAGTVVLGVALLALGYGLSRRAASRVPSAPARKPGRPPAVTLPPGARFLAVGGGAEPASNQVQIEQDSGLAARALRQLGPGVVLFGGGVGRTPVQVARPAAEVESLRTALGAFFDPRPERGARYRPATIDADGPATRDQVLVLLARALEAPTWEPFVVHLAGHGEPGEEPRDNLVRLWGGFGLVVSDLAVRLDAIPATRPLTLVVSTCFSGGFTELVFADANPARGPAGSDRCVLTSTTWDTEANGCDPDPDRRVQEGYNLHFFYALLGRDRHGKVLPMGELDLDGDGRVSLLEAHTRARIASRSIDVPTTSSERWLAEYAPEDGMEADLALPEEEAVVAALGQALSVSNREEAEARFSEVTEALRAADAEAEARDRELDEAYAALRMALLERWPFLEDPWHPEHSALLAREAEAIRRVLEDTEEARAYREAQDARDAAAEPYARLEVESALLERLIRAMDVQLLARRLSAQGGAYWEGFRRLRACERR